MPPSLRPSDFASGGYVVSRDVGLVDWTGTRLRPVTVAGEHSRRRFFPDAWAVDWVSMDDERRRAAAAELGLATPLAEATAWATATFGASWGAWTVCFDLATARFVAERFLGGDAEIWGLGLAPERVDGFLARHRPAPPAPGSAPMGASGTVCALERGERLDPAGTPLGFEVLLHEWNDFASLASRHRDEAAAHRGAGVTANRLGLLASAADAEAVAAGLGGGWEPWLLVSYPVT